MKKIRIILVDSMDLPLATAYKFPHASPPLGVQYLAAYVKQHLGDRVDEAKVISLPLALLEGRDPLDAAMSEIRSGRYDFIGIRSLTSGRDFLDLLTRSIKREFPDTPVVVGGPYASDSPALILADHPGVDYTCSQEGEEVLRQLLEAMFFGQGSVDAIPALGHRKDGKPVINSPMPWIDDVDVIPYPDYTHVDLERFVHVENPMRIPNGDRWAQLFTQRGCPYRCTYCHEGFGKLSRERSVENVLGEISWLYHEKGVRHFSIIDDIFNIRKQRAKEIMRGVIKSGMKVRFSFPNALRGDIMDNELVDLLVEAGTVCIHYAVESASPRIQKWIKKNLKLDKLNKTIEYTSQYDVLLRGFYMVGFPDETEQELKATIDHAIQSQFTETYFSILCMWPGTKIYEAAVADGFIPEGAWTSSTSHDLKNNGFKYPQALLAEERLRGYGHTHFSTGRMRKNLRICKSLGIPNDRVIEKETKYAQLLKEGWGKPGPIPFAPEPFLVDLLLAAGEDRLQPTAAYDVLDMYIAGKPGEEGRPVQPVIEEPDDGKSVEELANEGLAPSAPPQEPARRRLSILQPS